MSLAGKPGRATSVIGTSAIRPIGSKLSMELKRSVRYSAGAVDMPIWCRSTV